MRSNRGATSLRARKRSGTPMRDFDKLPPKLRAWTTQAVLPWRAKSVERAFARALRSTGCPDLALRELDRIQRKLIARDVQRVWGEGHPAALGAQVRQRAP